MVIDMMPRVIGGFAFKSGCGLIRPVTGSKPPQFGFQNASLIGLRPLAFVTGTDTRNFKVLFRKNAASPPKPVIIRRIGASPPKAIPLLPLPRSRRTRRRWLPRCQGALYPIGSKCHDDAAQRHPVSRKRHHNDTGLIGTNRRGRKPGAD